MNKISTIIVEDEQPCIDDLKEALKSYNEIAIIGEFMNVEEATEGLLRLNPDLVFMDVELKNDKCFSILNQLDRIDFNIVFVSAFESYAVKAFDAAAVHYLLKPINAMAMATAIKRVKLERFNKNNAIVYNMLSKGMLGAKQDMPFAIHSPSTIEYVKVSDIIRIRAFESYSEFILKDGKKSVASKKIGYFENVLMPFGFFRTHRSHIVNMQQVVKYYRGKGGKAIMSDSSKIEVAESRKAEFLRLLSNI